MTAPRQADQPDDEEAWAELERTIARLRSQEIEPAPTIQNAHILDKERAGRFIGCHAHDLSRPRDFRNELRRHGRSDVVDE
jgi:hypothetical protein